MDEGEARVARRVTVVLFDGFELLDVFGPVELLSMLPEVVIDYAGPRAGAVPSSQGARVVADVAYADLDAPDILLVPGGMGTRGLVTDERFLSWLADAGRKAELVTSVCTGSAALAAAGLLEGYRATSNKLAFGWASGFGDDVRWEPRARWVHDRDRWTASGVAAGMDMATALITELFGAAAADSATLRAEYEPHEDSTRDPFAEAHGLA